MKLRTSTKYVVVHCSATPANMPVNAALIDKWHRQRGWLKIGYHFVIKRDGSIEEGRKVDEIGAHVEGFNSQSVGVCMAGGCVNVNGKLLPENNFTPEQFDSLKMLLVHLKATYKGAKIVGHKELDNKKDCPSFDVQQWLIQEKV